MPPVRAEHSAPAPRGSAPRGGAGRGAAGPPGPRASASQSARRAASRHQGRPPPLLARSPRPSAPPAAPRPPPSRSPVAVRTNPRRSPSSAPSSSAPGGSATIPERSRCRDGGGTGTGGGGRSSGGHRPAGGGGDCGAGLSWPRLPGSKLPPLPSNQTLSLIIY